MKHAASLTTKARVLPKKAERISLGVRLPVQHLLELEAMSDRDPLRPSKGRLIELAVAEFLERRQS